jgi:hypothetical protein
MKRLILAMVGLTTLSACSHPPARRVSSNTTAETPDLTLPDTNLVRDTSTTASARSDQPVSPIEQQTTRSASPQPRPAAPKRKKPVTVARRPSPPADTAVKAYAPTSPSDTAAGQAANDSGRREPADSSARADTSSAAVRDSATSHDSGTGRADTSHAAALASDSVRSSPSATPDTLATRVSDTLASKPDTTRTAVDSAKTKLADSSGAAHAITAVASSTTAPPTTSTSNAAARTLPIGTEIHAALDDSITSRRDTVGQIVTGHVMENVTGTGGQTLIAAGTPVQFSISRIRPSYSKSSQGRLALETKGVTFNGRLQPVKATIQPVPRELRGRGVTGSDAAKVGGGAAAGAVLGGVVGGSTKGAVIGGVAGAAAGAVVANQTATRDVVVKAKTPLVLVLTAPLVAP